MKDNIHSKYLSKYRFLSRASACSNSRFDVFFDHLISNNDNEVHDFLIVKPKVTCQDKVGGICVLPILNKRFCLMHSWRHQFDEHVFQLPAGFIEKGELPYQTALRELAEETSLTCDPGSLISLGSYLPDAGLIEGRVALFLALNCQNSFTPREEEIGTGLLTSFTKSALIKLLFEESNIGGSTLATCYRALRLLENNKAYISCYN